MNLILDILNSLYSNINSPFLKIFTKFSLLMFVITAIFVGVVKLIINLLSICSINLPITMDPFKYGNLLEQIVNNFIISLIILTNISVITKFINENFVKLI